VDLFRAQVQALGEVCDIVDLDEILAGYEQGAGAAPGARPAVALTFDDDLESHVAEALPVLRDLDARAAFFLSGRALHGLGPYWFQELETLLSAHGNADTAQLLGLRRIEAGSSLVRRCEQDPALRQRIAALVADLPTPGILKPAGIATLIAAGMTIGFHTVDHGILPDLDDAGLEDAVSRGRNQLAAAAGAPVRHFAYPYGKVDGRIAAAVRRAGFDAAFTGRPEPLRDRNDRYRIGRWEPGRIGVDDLLVELGVRLHRAAPGPEKE
jgi:peptidoglycan/xylan/chitin deacetylase (PgdA/CDA1 family)